MEIRVLGPLTMRHNRQPMALNAGKPRQLLALLATQAGTPVSVQAMAEEVWGPRWPRSASRTLHSYIRQLRREIQATIEPGEDRLAKDVLVTVGHSYRLDPAVCEVDLHTCDRLSTTGSRLLGAGDFAAAGVVYRAALNLWRGPALVDVTHGMRLAMEVTRLGDQWLETQLRCCEAELRAGRHDTLLGELAVLNARRPVDERPAVLFMLALYRCGQQWRALEVFTALRRSMIAELGTEPSPRAHWLQEAILNSDPRLDDPARYPA